MWGICCGGSVKSPPMPTNLDSTATRVLCRPQACSRRQLANHYAAAAAGKLCSPSRRQPVSALQFFVALRNGHRAGCSALPERFLQFTKFCTIFTNDMEGTPIRMLRQVGHDPNIDKCKLEPHQSFGRTFRWLALAAIPHRSRSTGTSVPAWSLITSGAVPPSAACRRN